MRVPAASQTGEPVLVRPCQDTTYNAGGRTVHYTSTLSDPQIRHHYEDVARTSGWNPGVDLAKPGPRLMYAVQWSRGRCYSLIVARETTGQHSVEVSFGPEFTDRHDCR